MENNQMSQEEIDMLINNYDDIKQEKEKKVEEETQKSTISFGRQKRGKVENNLYKPIDFRKPNKLQYDNLGALKQIHEQFGKALNNYLTMTLRCSIQVDVDFETIDQISYHQYISLGNKHSLWGIFTVKDSSIADNSVDHGKCFFQLDTAFCNFFIDRSFGGSSDFIPSEDNDDTKMVDINKEISKELFKQILNTYGQSWNNSNIVNFNFNFFNIEDNSQNISLGIIASEMVLVIPIKISIFQKSSEDEEVTSNSTILKIGIPYSVIEPVLDKLNMSSILSSHKSADENNDVRKGIQKMNNNVDVIIGETKIQFRDLINLSSGDIIDFGKKASTPFDVLIGGKKKYYGKPYRNGRRLCIQIVKREEGF